LLFYFAIALKRIATYGACAFHLSWVNSMNNEAQKPKPVYVGGHVPAQLHRQMKIYSATHGMRLCDVLSLAIEHFLTSSSKTPD
jgi:hypothetical protein